MAKKNNITQYTADELNTLRARGESKSDWKKAGSVSQEQLEASIAADADEKGMEIDWSRASIEMPQPKDALTIRIDHHVLEFFKNTGRGYQTRINAVLKAFVEAQEHRTR